MPPKSVVDLLFIFAGANLRQMPSGETNAKWRNILLNPSIAGSLQQQIMHRGEWLYLPFLERVACVICCVCLVQWFASADIKLNAWVLLVQQFSQSLSLLFKIQALKPGLEPLESLNKGGQHFLKKEILLYRCLWKRRRRSTAAKK